MTKNNALIKDNYIFKRGVLINPNTQFSLLLFRGDPLICMQSFSLIGFHGFGVMEETHTWRFWSYVVLVWTTETLIQIVCLLFSSLAKALCGQGVHFSKCFEMFKKIKLVFFATATSVQPTEWSLHIHCQGDTLAPLVNPLKARNVVQPKGLQH